MYYGNFNGRTVVNACDRTRGFTDTIRESALKDDSTRIILCRTGESNLRQRRAGPMLYQLSVSSCACILGLSVELVPTKSEWADYAAVQA